MAVAREGATTFVAGVTIVGTATTQSRYIKGRRRGPDRPKQQGQKRKRTCEMCGDTKKCQGRWGAWKFWEWDDCDE